MSDVHFMITWATHPVDFAPRCTEFVQSRVPHYQHVTCVACLHQIISDLVSLIDPDFQDSSDDVSF